MVALCHLLLTSPLVLSFQSQFEKQAGRQTFDALKVDGWRVLTLHGALKTDEGIWRGGGEKVGLMNSFSSLPMDAGQARTLGGAR